MPPNACPHERRLTAVFNGDIGKPEDENTLYSTKFRLSICVDCGQTDVYCESHENVCAWLAGHENLARET